MIFKCILTLLFFVPLAFANCEDEETCFCSDITRFYSAWWNIPDESLFYSESLGCSRNLTCRLAKNTYFTAPWDRTTIPKPSEQEISEIYIVAMDDANLHRAGEFANLQELFGIICEDFKWYITKYPFGYSYTKYGNEENEWIHVDASEVSCDSHKTELRYFTCSDEDCQRKEIDMCYE